VKELLDIDRVHPIVNVQEVKNVAAAGKHPPGTAATLYARKVERLLYMAEFLLLINYVEVIIPLVFCKCPSKRNHGLYRTKCSAPFPMRR
jgi:hypothetical protein